VGHVVTIDLAANRLERMVVVLDLKKGAGWARLNRR
jgi:hypothetical protein